MTWERIDDLDDNGNRRVRYVLVTPPNYTFEIQATYLGVCLTGTTPNFTDYVPLQEKLSWAQYQAQRLKETGQPIPQNLLDRGTL